MVTKLGDNHFMIEFSTSKANLSFSEGILHMYIQPDVHLEIADFEEIFELRRQKLGDQEYAVLIDVQDFHTAEKETRDFLAEYNPPNQIGVAIVSKLIAIRLLANFFLNVSKPKNPTKLVASVEEGKRWLNSLLQEKHKLA